MEISLLATTSQSFWDKDKFNVLSGKLAGICYMPSNFETLDAEDIEKTLKRANLTKENGHHSVFDHEYVTLYLENVPKLFAMLLNNEKAFVTSEKSARYTKMEMGKVESELFYKWQEIFKQQIKEKYPNEPYLTNSKIEKLSQENARYFLSVYTPTCLAYTASYRQLNYLYCWMKNIDKGSALIKQLKPFANEFCNKLEKLNLIDKDLAKGGEERFFSLETTKTREEYFGDVYCTSYLGSFASFAQAQRHRTLDYQLNQLETPSFYVPKILRQNEKLVESWNDDMKKVSNLVPQGQLVQIYERGTPENFILKSRERLCTCAQLEIMEQTKETLNKYISLTKSEEVKTYLQKYATGARCTCEYKCKIPCAFKDGITLDREI